MQRLYLQWVFSHKYARNKAVRRSMSGGKIRQGPSGGGTLSRSREREILMPRTRRSIALGLLLAASVLLAQTALAQNAGQTAAQTAPPTTPHHKSHKTPKPLVLAPLPGDPMSQLPMDQLPSTPAKVSYQGGLLTISAQNSTLGEILRDVRKLTGASIEIPPGTNERVVTDLGPGAPRDVLAVLLNGSSFNYVMLGSNSDPTAVSSVILMAKPSAQGEAQTAANVYENNPRAAPANRFPPQPGQALIAPAVEADDSKDDDADDSADDQVQPQPQPGQPAQPGANAQDQQQQPEPNQPSAGPRTPEQILEMLRRQQQSGGAVVTPPQPPQQ